MFSPFLYTCCLKLTSNDWPQKSKRNITHMSHECYLALRHTSMGSGRREHRCTSLYSLGVLSLSYGEFLFYKQVRCFVLFNRYINTKVKQFKATLSFHTLLNLNVSSFCIYLPLVLFLSQNMILSLNL